jgi:ferredoxin
VIAREQPKAREQAVPRPPQATPAPAAFAAPAAPKKEGYEVEFVGMGKTSADPKKSLLDAASELGVDIVYSCREGACGTCRVLLKSGKVNYTCDASDLSLSDEEREQGYVLSCVAQPRSDCTVVVEG